MSLYPGCDCGRGSHVQNLQRPCSIFSLLGGIDHKVVAASEVWGIALIALGALGLQWSASSSTL